MGMEHPKIIIKYNRFLDPIFIGYIQAQPQWKDWTPPQKETVFQNIEMYRTEWKKYEQKIIVGMYQCTGLQFQQNIVDVHIVSGNPRPFSNPIVLKSTYSLDVFIDTLTHELIHRLFSNNDSVFPVKFLDDQFPNEEKLTKSHIFLFAVLQYIYLEVLKDPKRLAESQQRSATSKHHEYARAWEIVIKEGYQKLIGSMREEIKNAHS